MRLVAALLILMLPASLRAQVTIMPGSTEEALVRYLESNGCRGAIEDIFFAMMKAGGTIPGVQEVISIWKDAGWLVTSNEKTYTLKGVGTCK